MSGEKYELGGSCLCNTLRCASRAVSRHYDQELREHGLRTTQFSLLWQLKRGEVRQRDLGAITSHDETTLTRNLRPLIDAGWVSVRTGQDRREKWVHLTRMGMRKLEEARPAWERAQGSLRLRLSKGAWSALFDLLPNLTQLADAADSPEVQRA